MPNIMFFGYTDELGTARGEMILEPSKTFKALSMSIDIAMKDIKLQDEAVKTWVSSLVTTCDSKNKKMPFLRIFSSEIGHIPLIFAAFQKHKIEEDIEVLNPSFFIEGKDVVSGAWIKKWKHLIK